MEKNKQFVEENFFSHREMLSQPGFGQAYEIGNEVFHSAAKDPAIVYVSAFSLIFGGSTLSLLDEYLCATGLEKMYASDKVRAIAGGQEYERFAIQAPEIVRLNCGKEEGYVAPSVVHKEQA